MGWVHQAGEVGAGGTPATAEGVTRETIALEGRVAELRRLQASGRWVLTVTTLIVILQFAVFSWAMYRKLSSNFSEGALQKTLVARGNDEMPQVKELVMQTARASLPAYRDAFLAAIHTRGPVLAKAAEDRFEKVPQESGAMLQDRLQATFANVLQKIEPDFKKAFPNLSDEKRQQMVQAFLADQIDAQNKRIADHITQLGTNDLIKVQGALESFDLPAADAKPVDDDQLEHSVLHSMVMLLDDQLDATYGKTAADDLAAPAGLRVGMLGMPGMPSTQPTTQPMPQPMQASAVPMAAPTTMPVK